MAIKVKHEGSAASRMSASAAGGAAKRAMESAALVKPGQIQTLQAAHASAPGISTPHATLISAPGGGAHAPLIGGGGGVGSTSRVGGGSRQPASAARGTGGDDPTYKVTGTDRFSRPDDDSEWDWSRRQWIRRWLPGEKEAEAQKRIGMAQNEVYADRELTTQGRREREALVNDVVNAVKSRKFSSGEIEQLIGSFGEAEDRIRFADQFRQHEPTAQEQFAKNTYRDESGIVWSPDGKVLYNPNDAIIKQQEFAMKREDALKARADRFEAELRKPYKAMVLNDPDDPASGYTQGVQMRTEDEILKIMQKRYPSLYPSADNGGNGGGTGDPAITPITPTFDETRFPNSTKAAQAAAAARNAVPAPATQDAPAQARRQDDAYAAYADYEKR